MLQLIETAESVKEPSSLRSKPLPAWPLADALPENGGMVYIAPQ